MKIYNVFLVIILSFLYLMEDLTETATLFRPFLKWAGGKSRLIEQYKRYIPRNFRTYYEPFLGGGSVFFYLANSVNHKSILTDINPNLIEVYRCVRDKVKPLIACLEEHQIKHVRNEDKGDYPHYYYYVRSRSYDNDIERAARIIYLNKTCFNGLYRENSSGEFNVPLGKYKNPKICHPELLVTASVALQSADIQVRDFEQILKHATSDDFVYFDPPYYPINSTSYFTAYSRDSFTKKDQIRLRDTFAKLVERGVKVMLSNSECPFIREIYSDPKVFTGNKLPKIHEILAARVINSNTKNRKKIPELLITSG